MAYINIKYKKFMKINYNFNCSNVIMIIDLFKRTKGIFRKENKGNL